MSEELFESKEAPKLGPPMDEADATKVVDFSGMVTSGASHFGNLSQPLFRAATDSERKSRCVPYDFCDFHRPKIWSLDTAGPRPMSAGRYLLLEF